jgi:hypothetical protein
MCCLRGNPALLSPSWSSSVGNDSAITVRTVWLQRMLAAGLPQSEWGHPVKHMLQVYHLAPNTGAEKCDAACCKNACYVPFPVLHFWQLQLLVARWRVRTAIGTLKIVDRNRT